MRIFLLILYLLTIIFILFAEHKESKEALFWAVLATFLPFIGFILYLIFSSTLQIKLTSKIRTKRLKPYLEDLKHNELSNNALALNNLSLEDREVIHFNYVYNNSFLASYDSYMVFTDGKSHYEKLFKDILGAKDSIYILFYTIHHDEIGKALVNVLEAKAKEGVKVYVLIDFIANISDPPKMFRRLKKLGGKVVRIKPFLTHYRSHRKLVIIDHNISYIGGMNIGNKYLGKNKKKSPWRDTQVRLTGMAGGILDACFYKDYLTSTRKKNQLEMLNHIKSISYPQYEMTDNLCQFVMGGVDTNKESIKMTYLSLIRSAKTEIRIQTPYFVPDSDILHALMTAQASGVKIKMMLPLNKSSFFLDPMTTYYIGFLLEYGAEIYKYDGYVHAKTMIIDKEVAAIGSVNMDIRSMSVDDEICGIFFNNEFVNNYYEIYNEDLTKCTSYTYADFLKRGKKEKLLEDIFRLFTPLM